MNCHGIPLAKEGAGGAGKYIQSLIPDLGKKSELYVICAKHNAEEYKSKYIKELFEISGYGDLNISELCKSMDIYFCPANGLYPKDIQTNIPIVTEIYDLQHNHYPNFFSHEVFDNRNKEYGFATSRSDGIVTLSNWEKSNFEKYYNAKNVQPVYLSSYLEEQQSKEKYFLDIKELTKFSNYYLYPAIPWTHKNHYRLIEAFILLNKTHDDFNLILTGSEHSESKSLLFKKLNEMNTDFIQTLGHVKDDELHALMANAKGLVFPSLYEGFGIPILESMELGIPVIASNITAIPEVSQGAIDFFENPLDSYQIAKDILNFDKKIDNKTYDIEKARLVSSTYSVENTTSELMNYFKTLIETKKNNAPNLSTYNPKNNKINKSSKKITIIIDLYEIENHLQNTMEFFDYFTNNCKPELFEYAFLIPYEFRDKFDEKVFEQIDSFTTFTYYQEKILSSRILGLEFLLEAIINTEYFVCIDVSQFLNLNYSFLKKAVGTLDYFSDVFSCIPSNETSKFIIKPPDQENAIREFNRALSSGDKMLLQFYERLVRTSTVKSIGMIGSIPTLSKDFTTFTNIILRP